MTIKVFYGDAMLAEPQSGSPSAHKPAEVVQSWQRLGIDMDIVPPKPVSTAQLSLAHDADYVAGILAGVLPNGFGNRSPSVARSLAHTSGAMLAAARTAIDACGVAVAPCSGFHHAGYRYSRGYCTLNGLMVAACSLREEKFARRVGILDFDQHWGDGTHDIIHNLRADWVSHYSAGDRWSKASEAEHFLAGIPIIMDAMADCDVILYQAGADPHIDDPLGGWLTTRQLRLRDRIVFQKARAKGMPIAWNLAGGYQEPLRKVLDIHDNTMRECAEVFG